MTKKVRFYTGVEIDNNGNRHSWSNNAWQQLLDKCHEESQTFKIRNREITGKSELCSSPSIQYLHFTKNREISDWPEAGDTSGVVTNLATRREQTGIASILEYSYLLPVSGTPYIALLRSTSGPMPSAISSWITQKMYLPEDNTSFELQPVLRNDAQQKLNESIGVKSLEVRFEGKPNPDATSQIERAASIAAAPIDENDYVNMKIDMRISTGRASVVSHSTEAMRRQALSILANNNVEKKPDKSLLHNSFVTRLRANTLQENPNSDKPRVEQVDFIKEHLTEDVEFGSKKDDEMTPEIILIGMMEAINRFRNRSNEY